MSKPLSSAAKAIRDAARNAWSGIANPCEISAAAFRAATDHGEYLVDPEDGKIAVVRVSDLEAWAIELESSNA
jgi:hypothetical protein